MLNYWMFPRPKRRLDSVPEMLATFSEISLGQEWSGQIGTHIALEEALETAGLKRVGARRDQGGSGGRTYGALLKSLGLIFEQTTTNNIKLTLAGEAIMDGDSPVDVLKWQILKNQFPSAYSLSRGVAVNPRFRIRPFLFLLRLLTDRRLGYFLTEEEIAKVVIVNADVETVKTYEDVVRRILCFRESGNESLERDFLELYGPSKRSTRANDPYGHLKDVANTACNWIEYTQLAKRNEQKRLVILEDKMEEVLAILASPPPFLDRAEEEEVFQRKYGVDPKHNKDTRNLNKTRTITARILAEQKIKAAYIRTSLEKPITGITPDLIEDIAEETGITEDLVEEILQKAYPHGSIGAFMASYFEMAFKGKEECTEFEVATTELFRDVFGYEALHLGQTGSRSAPDILLLSDPDGYQAIIDTKAYSRYSISGDHHNRMVHNYLKRIRSYSQSPYPVGFFSYVAGGFGRSIDRQIQDEVKESGIHGSGITVSVFIKMIEAQQSGERRYSHRDLRKIFGLDRQIMLHDIYDPGCASQLGMVAEPMPQYGG